MAAIAVAALREGIEAFLIVALAATYLRQTGRAALLAPLAGGVAAAVALSLLLGIWLHSIAVTPLVEGVLALGTAALVGGLALHLARLGARLPAQVEAQVAQAAARPGVWAAAGVFLFATLMVTREGMELAFIAAALSAQQDSGALLAGLALGLAASLALAAAWLRWGRRIPLALMLRATTIFLALFVLKLLLLAFHEFTEAGALPLDNAYWHLATEEWVEGDLGTIYDAALIAVPLAWLWAQLRRRPVTPAGTG
ncbi:MAG TPA: FTR1 family protein [Burkholderiaceae bacterium]|jgi:high-affinity iron transporter|nr:FTR1 family protein [Burkholderiaceae bacterium]